MTKLELLQSINVGQRVAEQEKKYLSNYFVKTRFWRQLYRGNKDIIFGKKGTGKSALFMALEANKDALLQRGVVLIKGEKPDGKPISKSLSIFKYIHDTEEDPSIEAYNTRQIVEIWKLYFIILILESSNLNLQEEPVLNSLFRSLEKEKLISRSRSISKILDDSIKYIKKFFNLLEIEVKTPNILGAEATVKINKSVVTAEEDFVTLDEIINDIDSVLKSKERTVWIALDRLDVAFADDKNSERKVVSALFRTYLDLQGCEAIALKIFIRNDIWHNITANGFSEASHITRDLTIKWSKETFVALIFKRIINQKLAEYFQRDIEILQNDSYEQEVFLQEIFPEIISEDEDSVETSFIEWLTTELEDGERNVTPREVIHFLDLVGELQIDAFQDGRDLTSYSFLYSRECIENALNEVAKAKLNQTLLAEYPELRNFILAFNSELVQVTLPVLERIWSLDNFNNARIIALRLKEIGFLEKGYTETGEELFLLPKIYQRALSY